MVQILMKLREILQTGNFMLIFLVVSTPLLIQMDGWEREDWTEYTRALLNAGADTTIEIGDMESALFRAVKGDSPVSQLLL